MTHRPFTSAADLQAMINLVSARPAERVADYPGIVDLQEMLSTPEVHASTHLWEDGDGHAIGFAIIRAKYDKLLFEIAPGANSDAVATEMIAWGAQRLRETKPESDPLELETSCRDADTEHVALLKRHGFEARAVRTLHMARALAELIPDPRLPEGFVIRPTLGESEIEALVALHRAGYGTENLTVAERLAWMHAPEYEREMDLVAVVPDGTLAAYTMGSISHEENRLSGRKDGYTDPVVTHPAFQRRGLARALLLTGLRLLKERGMDTARLSTWGENVAMQRTAESVGFSVASTTVFFKKQIPKVVPR